MAFDYDQPDAPVSAVADVAAEIESSGKLPELSPEELEQRRIDHEAHLARCRERDEQWALEYRHKRAAIEAEKRQQAEAVAQQAREKARRESQERLASQVRDRELANLRYQVTQSQSWQRKVEQAAQNAVRQQHQAALREQIFADWKRMISPPPPEPGPEVIVEYVEREDPTKLTYPELQRWFVR